MNVYLRTAWASTVVASLHVSMPVVHRCRPTIGTRRVYTIYYAVTTNRWQQTRQEHCLACLFVPSLRHGELILTCWGQLQDYTNQPRRSPSRLQMCPRSHRKHWPTRCQNNRDRLYAWTRVCRKQITFFFSIFETLAQNLICISSPKHKAERVEHEAWIWREIEAWSLTFIDNIHTYVYIIIIINASFTCTDS